MTIATSKDHTVSWQALLETPPTVLQPLDAPVCREKGVQLWIKRDDQLQLGDDLGFCGNKWRKLKYNLLAAREAGYEQLLTFGGAFSNHVVATASAGRLFGFRTVGVIRGERPREGNASLRYAEACGMRLHFVERNAFRQKMEAAFIEDLHRRFGDFYLIPEGGSNALALPGCRELGRELTVQCQQRPLFVALACGTGGTLAGLAQGLPPEATALGLAVLKGNFLTKEVEKLLADPDGSASIPPFNDSTIQQKLEKPAPACAWHMINDYHFGGYAKFTPELIDFVNAFKEGYGMALDPIYTGKLLYGLFDLIGKDYFPAGAQIVAVHTGGLQGIRGFNERFGDLID